MTRKDFELIAGVLKNFTGEQGDVVERDLMAYAMAKALQEQHPRFDKTLFLMKAGVYSNRREEVLELLKN